MKNSSFKPHTLSQAEIDEITKEISSTENPLQMKINLNIQGPPAMIFKLLIKIVTKNTNMSESDFIQFVIEKGLISILAIISKTPAHNLIESKSTPKEKLH